MKTTCGNGNNLTQNPYRTQLTRFCSIAKLTITIIAPRPYTAVSFYYRCVGAAVGHRNSIIHYLNRELPVFHCSVSELTGIIVAPCP
jgi:hypothetical protein